MNINTAKTGNSTARSRGFTIIETMIAISVLAIALTGPLSIIAQALKNSYFARDQITAYYLAQEAIEVIRNKRDNNALSDTPPEPAFWLAGLIDEPGLVNDQGYEGVKVNLERTTGGYMYTVCPSTCPPLKYADPANTSGYVPYGQREATEPSIFTREVVFNRVSPDTIDDEAVELGTYTYRELAVTVRVTWTTPSGKRTVVLRDNINNWQIENF
ncbi:MAG TPA: prepilin-type N-terminal cleavage/methylation domain-containing protein [Candidatus Paceibacterota bacterium]